MIRTISAVLLVATVGLVATGAAYAGEKSEERKICRSERPTGSIMRRSVCHTESEWAALEEKSKADKERTRAMEQSRGTVSSSRD